MITFFRRIFSSKIGLFLSLAFIVLIGIAFAGADVTGSSFGGVAGGNVAKVGDTKISISDLREEVKRRYDDERQQNPTLDLASFVRSGAVDRVLEGLIGAAALEAYANKIGFGSTKALEDAEIRKVPSFFGIDGSFDQTRFESALAASGLTERRLRDDIRRQLLIRQLTGPVAGIKTAAPGLTLPYASLLLESRTGHAAFLPAAAYAPQGTPDSKAVTQFYARNTSRYTIPERRVIRYAEFGEADLGKAGDVTDADVSRYYAANTAQYGASQARRITQVIAGDKAVADKIAAAAKAGTALPAAAKSNGLSTSEGRFASAAEMASSVGAAAAKAVFSASQGAIVGPVQGNLGWVVTSLDGIDGKPARTLAEVSGEIRKQLTIRKRQEALIDLFNTLQDSLSGGTDIAELADARGLKLVTTPAITANGTVPGGTEPAVAATLAPVIAAAFQASDENFGEIVPIEENKRYAMTDVARIVAAAPPPLKTIQDRVAKDYRLAEGGKRARTVARKIAARIVKGESLETAVAAEKVPGFTIQKIGGKRTEITRAQGRVPPELALLFSMAAKSAKTIELGDDRGWMVVYLDAIDEGDAKREPGLIEAVSGQLGEALGNEYVAGLLAAAKQELGVEINADVVAALKAELTGSQ